MFLYYMYLFIYCLFITITDCQLYDYGPDAGDTRLNTTEDQAVYNTIGLRFLGRSYDTIHISWYGMIGFTDELYYRDQQWRDNPRENNQPFIAPYYCNIARPSTNIPGHVYHRLETNKTFLEDLGDYLQTAVVGLGTIDDLSLRWAVIVTWENVVDVSATRGTDCLDQERNNICHQTNTFQILLTSSSEGTFAVFNYQKMDLPSKPSYQAGINGGLNRGWTDVYCGADCSNIDFTKFPNLYGSDVKGRFIYRVDEERVVRGGCLPPQATGGKQEISPKAPSSFGGEIIDVSGYCISNTTRVQCRYGVGEPIDAIYTSTMIVRCLTPRLTAKGLVPLEIRLDGAESGLSTYLNVAHPSRTKSYLYLTNDVYKTDADEVSVRWEEQFLSVHPNSTVIILLIGYRETDIQVIWKTLEVLGVDQPNTGEFMFKPSEHRCQDEDCELFEIGHIEVRLNPEFLQPNSRYGFYSSGVIPIGWYVVDHMLDEYGAKWSEVKCVDWYKQDKQHMDWLEDLLDCPCTLTQALTDFGRWQPDAGCSLFSGSVCTYHIGAVHCVRAFEPTEADGSGNQCCYGPDGKVRYAADSYQGSTPDRSHDWGAAPYNKPNYIPALSHWKHDVITFYYCCLWVEYEYCDYYMDQRATRDCKNYNPPKTASVFGESHIYRFDGVGLTGVGEGDYWLVKTSDFQLQGRFQQVSHLENVSTTALVGISLQEESSSRVEVRVSHKNSANGRQLTVLVDDEITVLDTKANKWQDLKGLTIINYEDDFGISEQKNVTIVINTGIGVQVSVKYNRLHVIVVLPQSFKDKSRGLLGSWSEKEKNHLRLPDDSMISNTLQPRQIYTQFILQWNVTEPDSLFQYPAPVNADLQPMVDLPPLPDGVTADKVADVCGDHVICQYDYRATGNADVGKTSMRAAQWFQEIQRYQVAVGSCGLLDVPRSLKSSTDYSINSTITITGCKRGLISGPSQYTCTSTGEGGAEWQPHVDTKCTVPQLGGTSPAPINQPSLLRTMVMILLLICLNKL